MSEAILRVAQQTPAAVAGLWTSSILLILALGCQALGYTHPADSLWMACTGAAVLLGAAALGWLRPQRVGFTAPQAMLVLGALGMLLGLAIDSRTTDLGAFASLCAQTDKSLGSMLKLHWELLPWMHAGMWVGGFAAIPLLRTVRPHCRRQFCARVGQNIACSAWMTLGMAAGVLVFEYLIAQAGQRSAASMLGGMFAGMVWGMVASVALYRLYFRVSAGASVTSSFR
jgi:hypothetical protein